MLDLDAERRAFAFLQWVPYSLPTEFDEDLAADGYYTKTQKQRSNAALDAFDKQHVCTEHRTRGVSRTRAPRPLHQRRFLLTHEGQEWLLRQTTQGAPLHPQA